MQIQTISIVGVGLIGGSFGLALRANGFQGRIIGVSSARTIYAALRKGAIDEAMPLDQAVKLADVVYLAQPIRQIIELLPTVQRNASPRCLVTDAGSTKREIVAHAEKIFDADGRFLGGHPMAGKALRGVEQAEADLFKDANYVLTPSGGRLPDREIVSEFRGWIEKIGARPIVLSPEDHDAVVTWTSHLPQLLSTALALTVSSHLDDPEHFNVAGPGLRDMTRLAQSSYDIWGDILFTNADHLEKALEELLEKIKYFQKRLGSTELERDFEAARKFREKLFPT